MLRLLDPHDDRQRWLDAWTATGREPFAHPDFGRLLAGPGDRCAALLHEDGGGTALVPVVVRRLAGTSVRDAVSPYGYGGPFTAGDVDAVRLLERVQQWVREEQLCSLFLRLSLSVPLEAGQLSAWTEVRDVQENVVVDLGRPADLVWTQYEHKVRKNVHKARRAGCVVERASGVPDPDEFAAVYGETMERRGAGSAYRFDAAFFASWGAALGECCSVFTVRDPTGRAVSVELVLESAEHLYSFLGGTLREAFPTAPNDLLKHEVVRWGAETGRSSYVLGGGVHRQDGVFRYKRAFDRSGVRMFRVACVVGDRDAYDRLTAERDARGARDPAYFPAYRAP